MKIAFTSCTRYESFQEQPEWNLIADENPDYLFLLGDNIYMDYGLPLLSDEPNGAPKEYGSEQFEQIMNQKYFNQFHLVPSFKNLVQKMRAKNGFYAIWDDHDFAWNDAKGVELTEEKMKTTTALFHQYLDCSTNLPHTYYHVDTPLARAIFIDNRTDAEPEGEHSKLLSDAQFAFIEDKLNHDLPYTLLCGGITITENTENWLNYPSQLKKLTSIIKDKKNLLFLGGDIHCNRFVRPRRIKELGIITPFQLISSGMQVDYWGSRLPFDDRHNWAMLKLTNESAKIDFYDKDGRQKRMSNKATKYLKRHLKLI